MILRVTGHSMEPFLPRGVRVLVRPGPARPGDVAVVRDAEGMLVVHRIISSDVRSMTLQGDNHPLPDYPVDLDKLRGVVSAVEFSPGKWEWYPRWAGWIAASLTEIRPGILRQLLLKLLHGIARRVARAVPPPRQKSNRKRREPTIPRRFEYQAIGDETAVYDTATGDVHFLNATAAWILQRACEGAEPDSIAEEMTRRFTDVALDRACADVAACIEDMKAKGLITRAEPH
ncbi:HPr-rel-A system PqqD family peptide chaperone [bacterium]|nr:HPr-rel-A system PqqD family peptide chaperone [bacterium]